MNNYYEDAERQELFGELDSVEMKIINLIKKTSNTIDLIASKELSEYNLSLSQFVILCLVYFSNKKLMLSDLSRSLNVSKPTISGLVGRLKKKEFVKLEQSEDDARVSYILMSEEGEKVVKITIKRLVNLMRRLLGEVPRSELDSFLNLNNVFYNNLRSSQSMED